jgi:hypothetical protein
MIRRAGLRAHVLLRHGRASSRVLQGADSEVTGIFPRAPGGPVNALVAVHHGTRDQRQRHHAPGL